jgi:hypothetical protein
MSPHGWILLFMIAAVPIQVIPAYFWLKKFPMRREHLAALVACLMWWIVFAFWFFEGIQAYLLAISFVGVIGPAIIRTWKLPRQADGPSP